MSHLSKSITLGQGIGLLVTTMMGTGVFILPQLTAKSAGSTALVAWSLLILLMIPITWVFGTLGKKYPSAGGPAHFVNLAFGEYQGQVVGLMYLLLVPVGAPAAIEITMQFVNALIPISGITKYVVELCFLLLIFLVNRKGLTLSGTLQSGLTIAMLVIVVAIFLSHLMPGQKAISSIPVQATNWPVIATTMGLAFWSFMGIETMSHLSEEFKNPEKDFGKALNLGVILVGIIYFVCTFFVLMIPESTSSLIMIDVFDNQFGSGGKWIIGILGIASGAAAVNVYNASVARLAYNMAGQKAIPSWLHELNQHKIPTRALASILTMIAIVLAITTILGTKLEELILWTNGVFVLIYLLTMLAAVKLLSGAGRMVAMFSAFLCFLLSVSLMSDMIYAGFLIVVLSFWVRRRSFFRQYIH